MIGNTYLKLVLLKRKIPFKAPYPYKGTRKVEDFQKLSYKEIYFTLQSNSTKTKNFSNSIHDQTFLKDIIFSVKSEESFDGYIYSVWYTLIHFSLPLNPAIPKLEWATRQRFRVPYVENKKSLSPILYLFFKLSKITLDFIIELINLNYSFNISFKISLQTTRELSLNSIIVYS